MQHANRVVGGWINFYNRKRQHQALGMKTPAEMYALVGSVEQVLLGYYRTAPEKKQIVVNSF